MLQTFYKIIVWIAFTVNFSVLIVNLRKIIEAFIVRKADLDLESKRLEIKAALIRDREQRRELRSAEKLIQREWDTVEE